MQQRPKSRFAVSAFDDLGSGESLGTLEQMQWGIEVSIMGQVVRGFKQGQEWHKPPLGQVEDGQGVERHAVAYTGFRFVSVMTLLLCEGSEVLLKPLGGSPVLHAVYFPSGLKLRNPDIYLQVVSGFRVLEPMRPEPVDLLELRVVVAQKISGDLLRL